MRDIKYLLEYYNHSFEVWRAGPTFKLVASCPTMESAMAAKRLLHGEEKKIMSDNKKYAMKDYFSLHTNPEDLLSAYAYNMPGKRVKMKLICGKGLTTVCDMDESKTIYYKGIEHGVVLKKVRVHGVTEVNGIMWRIAGPGEEGTILEGWVVQSAFSH